MKEIFYRSEQTELRRKLRRSMNKCEHVLWNQLRSSRFCGFKFRRQAGIGRYVADFYCFKARLIIEIDGRCHESEEAREYDEIRDTYMQNLGLHVLRFSVWEIMRHMEFVLQKIHTHLPPHIEEGLREERDVVEEGLREEHN